MAHLEPDVTDLSSPLDLTLNGYLESRSFVCGPAGRVVRMSLLVPTASGDRSHEIIAYDEHAEFCLASSVGDLVRVRVRRPTESELSDVVQHSGMVVQEIGPFTLVDKDEDDEEDGTDLE